MAAKIWKQVGFVGGHFDRLFGLCHGGRVGLADPLRILGVRLQGPDDLKEETPDLELLRALLVVGRRALLDDGHAVSERLPGTVAILEHPVGYGREAKARGYGALRAEVREVFLLEFSRFRDGLLQLASRHVVL